MTKRRGFTLVFVLGGLALVTALVVPLALLSGTRAAEGQFALRLLAHRLAGDSLIAVLPEWLARRADLRQRLERGQSAELRLIVGEVEVLARVQDDSAKVPLGIFQQTEMQPQLVTALNGLQRSAGLPPLSPDPQPASLMSLDDPWLDADDAAIFGDFNRPAWADWLTSVGQRINLNGASPLVLEAGLGELKPGIGVELERLRRLQPAASIEEHLAACGLPEPARRTALHRLTQGTERYSLLIRTEIAGDVRWRYAICTTQSPPDLLVDWEVSP